MKTSINKAESIIELKDGRFLLTYNNGFTYYVLSAKGVKEEEVSEEYFKEQLRKHRITKKSNRELLKTSN